MTIIYCMHSCAEILTFENEVISKLKSCQRILEKYYLDNSVPVLGGRPSHRPGANWLTLWQIRVTASNVELRIAILSLPPIKRVLPSIVADEPASVRRRSKLSVVSVQISLENANPHFLDADGRNYQSHDISMPCDSAYWPNSPDVIIKIILEVPFWWSMSTCVVQRSALFRRLCVYT